MQYVKDNSYHDIPFCLETRHNDFYTYMDLKQVSEESESHKDEIVKCRTIGILQSLHGRFYLTDYDSSGTNLKPLVQVSVVYLPSLVQSTVMSYPVQIFGTLQWKNRPVIFAKILQEMNVSTALRMKKALRGITSIHLAKSPPQFEDEHCVDPT